VPNETQYKLLYQFYNSFFLHIDKLSSSDSLWEQHALTQIGGWNVNTICLEGRTYVTWRSPSF